MLKWAKTEHFFLYWWWY